MTKNTKCTDCHIRPIDKSIIGPDLCTLCLEYAGWENQHEDDGHERLTKKQMSEYPQIVEDMKSCPVCHPELDPRNVTKRVGHSNKNAAGPHFDHSQCAHEATKSARAKCRKQMRDSKPADVECPTCHANVTKGEKCMTRTGKIAKQSHNDRPSK